LLAGAGRRAPISHSGLPQGAEPSRRPRVFIAEAIAARGRMKHTMPDRTPYQRSAERCRELAARAESDEERNLLLRLAESWDWVSREGDAAGEPPQSPPKPQRQRGP
jgi:hypothetical protein